MISEYKQSQKHVGIIIQARMASTRLPGKVMLPLAGKPVLQHIIERLKQCQEVKTIVLATTRRKDDDVLVKTAKDNSIIAFRGSENDVLSRYYYAAKENKLDVIVRITADTPIIDPDVLDKMLLNFNDLLNVDYYSNVMRRTFPRGLDVEIITFSALKRACMSADKDYQKEHVAPYIREHPEIFMINDYYILEDNSRYRLCLDTPEDYELLKIVYERLYPIKPNFRLNDLLRLLKEDESLSLINAHVEQKKI
jgi:spore coat polysaccharide biosynthesis protein SpsF